MADTKGATVTVELRSILLGKRCKPEDLEAENVHAGRYIEGSVGDEVQVPEATAERWINSGVAVKALSAAEKSAAEKAAKAAGKTARAKTTGGMPAAPAEG